MIYIYHDFGGTHTTSLAAAYHLKILIPSPKVLTKEEILSVPYFNELTKKDTGRIIFHGKDDDGNPVYTIGRRRAKFVVTALKDLYLLLQEKSQAGEKVIFSNTSPTVPFAMTMGGFFSRGLGIDFIGVPLLIKGSQKCGNHIFQLVEETKRMAKSGDAQNVIILDNKKFQA